MSHRIRKILVLSLVLALVPVLAMRVPFVGLVAYLLTSPLHRIWPELGRSGELVDFGFAWIVLKKGWLWPVFHLYFFAFLFPILLLLSRFLRSRSTESSRLPVAIDEQGWVRCPFCEERFSVQDPAKWDGTRHLVCGVSLHLAPLSSVEDARSGSPE